jgi:hypothetical protein
MPHEEIVEKFNQVMVESDKLFPKISSRIPGCYELVASSIFENGFTWVAHKIWDRNFIIPSLSSFIINYYTCIMLSYHFKF